MKKPLLLLCILSLLLLISCGNKNLLFKDDVYTVTKGEQGVVVTVIDTTKIPDVHSASKEYIDTDSLPCFAVLEYNENTLTVASHYYDGDAKDSFKLWKLTTAQDVSFNMVSLVDDKGTVTIDNIELPVSDYQYIGEYYTHGYFEFNDTGEVSHITFYGETIIQ